MSIQSITRAQIQPPIPPDAPEWFRYFIFQNWSRLAQQVNAIHSAFQAYQIAVAGAAGTQALTLTTPEPDLLYTPLAIPTWSTTIFVSAISKTGVTWTFGTAAPGGGGTLYVLVVR